MPGYVPMEYLEIFQGLWPDTDGPDAAGLYLCVPSVPRTTSIMQRNSPHRVTDFGPDLSKKCSTDVFCNLVSCLATKMCRCQYGCNTASAEPATLAYLTDLTQLSPVIAQILWP